MWKNEEVDRCKSVEESGFNTDKGKGKGELGQCFSTARPRPGTGPWRQLYQAARDSPGICHFSFQSIFHE